MLVDFDVERDVFTLVSYVVFVARVVKFDVARDVLYTVSNVVTYDVS